MQKKYDFTPAQPICQEIDRLLVSSKSPVIVAIDGVCGGGKTTLGEWLAMQYDCNLFHMDDFFLQNHQRTEERLSEVGGNVDVKGLADLDYFKNRLFGSARVPKQFFGDTDDGAGFNGGESLSQISSRYAKMIKRIQNSLIQMVTDAFNLYMLDKDLGNYINKFTLHMQPPATLEERTRQENKANKVGLISDIQNILSDIENPVAKLKITKSLLSTVVDDPEVFDIMEQEIKKMQDQIDSSVPMDDLSEDNDLDLGSDIPSSAGGSDYSFGSEPLDMDTSAPTDLEEPEESPDTVLPSPDQLGVDLTDNNSEI